MQACYRYVRIENLGKRTRYLRLGQNPVSLAWSLYFYGKPLGFRGSKLRQALGGLKNLSRTVISLLYYKFRLPSDERMLELPVSGDLCLQAKHGYKIFDFHRKKVFKVFSPGTDPAIIQHEIETVRWIGEHNFAPDIHHWNIQEGWYEEDYINGYSLTRPNWTVFLEVFQASVAPLLARLVLVSPPSKVDAFAYTEGRSELVRSEQSKLADAQLDAKKVDTIIRFVESTLERLTRVGDRSITLACSHGDFSPGHVLKTAQGAVIIDWEVMGQRSVLYDLHDYFFERLWLGYAAPGMAVALQGAISQVQSLVAQTVSSDHRSLLSFSDDAEMYRWIYYIERVCKVVERQKMTDDILDSAILPLIDTYDCYEDNLSR